MPKSDPLSGWLLAAGILAGLLVLALEFATLGVPSSGLVFLDASLVLSLGVVVGLALLLTETGVARFSLGPLPSAVARALVALPLIVFATWRLFEGSYASTLLDPSVAHWLCPAVAFALLVAVNLVAFHPRWRSLGPWALRLPLVAGLILMHLAANSMLLRGYPDLQGTASILAVVCATLLVANLLPRPLLSGRWTTGIAGLCALVLLCLGWTSTHVLDSTKNRWDVALQHGHSAHLIELARRPFDRDNDGYASLLGGGDCRDDDATINPTALEVVDNGIDEDCDGSDLLRERADLPDLAGYDDRIATWLATPRVTTFLQGTADMDVVVFFVDTLRADLLKENQENRQDFPRLFEFLDSSRKFDRAFSPAAGTDVAMGTLLTGKIDPFVKTQTTLFEAIAQRGHKTFGVFPGEVLRWAGRTLISRGLDQVREIVTDRETPDHGSHSASLETTQTGLALLREHQGPDPIVLWLHYFDVHEHLQLPGSAITGLWSPGTENPGRVANYRGTLKLVDQAFGVLVDEIRARGRWDKTIIVLASDHGESMLEDPRLPKAHGLYVYNPLIHVPLAIRIPGVAPRSISVPVALADLTPTLLALTGAAGAADTEAHTLLHHLVDGDDPGIAEIGWPILLHEQNQWGILVWPYKLMVRPEDNLKELYDLSQDFAETRDLSFVDPEKVRALQGLRQKYPPFKVVRTMDIIRQREGLAEAP